ncbi:type II toxin-antitoxin system VapC family toxin [bacterium]|nr:type II toxin-antitoxin system VapC family toxin [bacterium]
MSNHFLIDTRMFLWLNFSPEKLSQSTRDQLQDRKSEVFVSVISFWEISLKYQLGKLSLSGILPHELLSAAEQMGIQIANIAPNEFATFCQLPSVDGHKDPFDRLIIWQCIVQNKVLVSHDSKLNEYVKLGLNVFI